MNAHAINGNLDATGKPPVHPVRVFGLLWALLFLLYLPTVNAGWVSDTVEWLQKIKSLSFKDYVFTEQSRGSTYQFTQVVTYVLYKLFGQHPWPWYLLFITLHAVNCTLLFVIFKRLFDESGVKNGMSIAAGSVLLFCVCPHISEVIVWKAAYHYLQALLMILVILYFVQKFHSKPHTRYALLSALIFLASTFSHELFYLTPFFVLTLIVYYRTALRYDKLIYKKALLFFALPLFALLILHFILILISTGHVTANLGDEVHQPVTEYLRKPALYLFHTLFLGRFFSPDGRQKIYELASSRTGMVTFYALLALLWLYIALRFKNMRSSSKAVVLVFLWLQICIAMVCPVWFPQTLLVNFDRYTYFMLPFIYILFMFLLMSIRVREWSITFFIVYAFINVICTLRANKSWGWSAKVANGLIHNMPSADNKIILLLNVPEYMNGVPVIGPFLHFSFQKMYNLYNTQQINNTMFDVVSYNMSGPDDGAHINVYNDSLMHVTLNQWGTWWWYGMWGASSYENEYYRVNMMDMGHWYELTLKRPASDYLILYNIGDKWKVVDWNKKNDDQN